MSPSSSPVPVQLPARQPLAGLTILVVEDHALLRDAMILLLEGAGMTVVAASRVGQAIEVFGASRPNLIISDLGLPDGDGCAFMSHVRASNDPSADVPSLAISASLTPERHAAALAAGFDACLAKPQLGRLLERLEALRARQLRTDYRRD